MKESQKRVGKESEERRDSQRESRWEKEKKVQLTSHLFSKSWVDCIGFFGSVVSRMGIELDRCVNPTVVQESFFCSICCEIFDDPKESVICGHIFCSRCINTWIFLGHNSCPLDRSTSLRLNLKRSVSMNEKLSNLHFKCKVSKCSFIGSPAELVSHEKSCYNPFQKCRVKGQNCYHTPSYRRTQRSLELISNESLRMQISQSNRLFQHLNIDSRTQQQSNFGHVVGGYSSTGRGMYQQFQMRQNSLRHNSSSDTWSSAVLRREDHVIQFLPEENEEPESRTRIVMQGSIVRSGVVMGRRFRAIFGRGIHGWKKFWSESILYMNVSIVSNVSIISNVSIHQRVWNIFDIFKAL